MSNKLQPEQILNVAKDMIQAMKTVKGDTIIEKKQNIMKNEKFAVLANQYFAIFKAILQGYVREDNFHIMRMMINQRQQIDQGKKTKEQCEQSLGKLLANEYNFNWELFTPRNFTTTTKSSTKTK